MMKLFPHSLHTAGVFPYQSCKSNTVQELKFIFLIKKPLLNISVSWLLIYSYKKCGDVTESQKKQSTTDMKASTVIFSNRKE